MLPTRSFLPCALLSTKINVVYYKYEVPELYRSVGIIEIEEKGWTLTPSKYIEFIDHDLEIDYEKEMARIQSEMQEIMKAEKKSQQMLEDAFRGIGYVID